MSQRLFAMATVLVLVTSAATAETMSSDQGWTSVKKCAQEETERARHACLDRVLREAGVLTDEMHARQQKKAFGLEEKPARAATPSGPATAPASAPAGAASAAPAQPEKLDVELAKVEKATSGRLFVTTTDGAVWLQMESVEMPLPPVAGDHMSIRKGSLGGYRCTIASTHLTYRCARNR